MSSADDMKHPMAAALSPYGPYAFGAIILLTIWYSIVVPMMDKQAIIYANNEKIIMQLREVSINQTTQTLSMEKTVTILERAITSMEMLVDKLQELKVNGVK